MSGPRCKVKADIAIAIDSSLSVTEQNFKRLLSFVDQIIRDIGVGNDVHRFAIITFNTLPVVEVHLKDYISNEAGLEYDVLTLDYNPGHTNTAGVLKLIREQVFTFENGDRPAVPNLALIITDGIANINRGLTSVEAVKSKTAGIRHFAVGISLPSDHELKAIVDKDDDILLVNGFDYLEGHIQLISGKLCAGI